MKKSNPFTLSLIALVASSTLANANLVMKVGEPRTIGAKTAVKLELKNTFGNKIESVRATLFLIDEQGKAVGQMTRWVVGGTKDRPGLVPNASRSYEFVVTTERPFTSTKVLINRIVLEGGKLADVTKEVTIENDH